MSRFVKPFVGRPLSRNQLQYWPSGRNPSRRWIWVGGAAVLGGLYYITHLETVPVSGRKRVMLVGREWDRQIANSAYQSLLREYQGRMISPSHPSSVAVEQVARRLVAASSLQSLNLNWQVHLVHEKELNAFVLPNGKIFVFTGMLPIMQNQDGVAAVLGHEIAHVVARHSSEQTGRQMLLGAGLLALSLMGISPPRWLTHLVVGAGIILPFSRDCESEADRIGLDIMSRACFDPNAAVAMWRRMKAAEIHSSSELNEYFSTHPSHDHRIRELEGLLDGAMRIKQENNVQVLQTMIENITYCRVDDEDGDPNLVKLFQISQLIVEFLLHSQSFLLNSQQSLQDQILALERQLERESDGAAKLRRECDEKHKEVKTLKKALFAYELVAKMPGSGGRAPSHSTVSYHRCRFCEKAFSTEAYVQAHESRRHPDLVSAEGDRQEAPAQKPAAQKDAESTAELKKMVQQMMAQLSAKQEPEPPQAKESTLLHNELQQEKLKFELELQALKATLHREIEEERAILRQDREAFEKIVTSQTVALSHLGDLEEDEDSKRHSRPPSRQSVAKDPSPQTIKAMESKFEAEIALFKERLARESESQTKSLEEKLALAASEIQKLRQVREETKPAPVVAKSSVRTSTTGLAEPPVVAAEPRSPALVQRSSIFQAPDTKAEPTVAKPTDELSSRHKKEIWKLYSAELRKQNHVPNPHAKWATSKYHHPVAEMQNQKEILTIELDQFLAARGLTDVNIAKLSTDPTLQLIVQQVADGIQAQRMQSSQTAFYNEMRTYLENTIDSAANIALNNEIHSPVAEMQLPPLLPRRSSMKKSNSGTMSPTKTVKLSDNVESRLIDAKSVVAKPESPRQLRLAIPKEALSPSSLLSLSSVPQPSPSVNIAMSPSRYSVAGLMNAFSSISRSLTSPKKSGTEKFEAAMSNQPTAALAYGAPPSPVAKGLDGPPKKLYMDLAKDGGAPLESSASEASSHETSSRPTESEHDTTTATSDVSTNKADESSEVNITQISQQSLQQKPAAPKPLSATSTDGFSSVSEVSEIEPPLPRSVKQSLPFQEQSAAADDLDSFDVSTDSSIANTKALPRLPTRHALPAKQVSGISSTDDDVLEFLDQIDASLDQTVTGKPANEIPKIDDIDDFDSY
ncbi:hypothetical protein HDU91_005569 [Kappamyces sp. JEL0680]|nr:hypothetical protein HDU91_005569 [Kappamyces sp. JEL0680]